MPSLRHWQVTKSRTLPFCRAGYYAPLRHWQGKTSRPVIYLPRHGASRMKLAVRTDACDFVATPQRSASMFMPMVCKQIIRNRCGSIYRAEIQVSGRCLVIRSPRHLDLGQRMVRLVASRITGIGPLIPLFTAGPETGFGSSRSAFTPLLAMAQSN